MKHSAQFQSLITTAPSVVIPSACLSVYYPCKLDVTKQFFWDWIKSCACPGLFDICAFEFLLLLLTSLWCELLCTRLKFIRWKVSGGKIWWIVLIIYLLSLVNCATDIIVHLEPHYNMSQHAEMVVVDFFNTLYFLDMECLSTSSDSSFNLYKSFSFTDLLGLSIWSADDWIEY